MSRLPLLAALLSAVPLGSCREDAAAAQARLTEETTQAIAAAAEATRTSLAALDAAQLIAALTEQMQKVHDRTSAVQARQAIEVQLRLLRQKLPTVAEGQTAVASVFASVLAGQEQAVQRLLELADKAHQDSEIRAILDGYLVTLRAVLK